MLARRVYGRTIVAPIIIICPPARKSLQRTHQLAQHITHFILQHIERWSSAEV